MVGLASPRIASPGFHVKRPQNATSCSHARRPREENKKEKRGTKLSRRQSKIQGYMYYADQKKGLNKVKKKKRHKKKEAVVS